MVKKTSARWLALLLAMAMLFGLMPAMAFADGEAVDTAAGEDIETTDVGSDEAGVADYASFLAELKVLEGYADEYAAANTKYSANELTLNFIRTGVERYNDGNWKTLAGEEITDFTAYVEAQDAANGTTAMRLRNIIIENFYLPNGNQTDFGHMFGTMNISWVASRSADLAGWAGDLCDLILFSRDYGNVPAGTVEEMAAFILNNCFGVDADDAFGMDDFYGDMDAYYLIAQMKAGTALSAAMEAYFTAELNDGQRSAYFLNNRFGGLETREDVREAVYNAYSADVGIQVLEADRDLADETDMRTASCYALADYMFNQGGHLLDPDSGSGDDNTGDDNTGDDNTGDDNTGDDNTGDDTGDEETTNPYYNIFSSAESVLAPGITQTINYALTADGKQIVYYVATVDVTRDDVTIMANYKDNDPSAGWGMQRVEDQAAALLAKHTDPDDAENYIENFNVIVATNADGYNMSTGEPGGLLVMEGKEWHAIDGDGFFAIMKDGSAMIGTKADYEANKAQVQEGIGAFGAVLIKDGEIAINKSSNYYTSRASRTAIGITAEGKVVMMVLDGRQEPFSAGGSMEEIAQIMLEAGCVEAVNLDGGGSTTYLSKPEGKDSLQLINRPSDGFARSVSTSLAAVSTAKSSREFDHANISSEYDYLTIGTSLTMSATGVSNTGSAAPIPEGAVWQLSDSSIGSISAEGVFTAAANGDVDVQLAVDGTVVGSKTLHVVVPDTLEVEGGEISVIYGVPTTIPFKASYQGAEVAFNEGDIYAGLENESAGTLEGVVFTGDESSGVRRVLAAALILATETEEDCAYVEFYINLYKDGEAVFDFNDATAGNRQLAWDRDVSNSVTSDDYTYYVADPQQEMDISYVFALDMKEIEVPAQLADLTYMLPGADTGATAWDFLLQLAERVSEHTEVKVEVQIDPDLDIDYSELTVHNDFFRLAEVNLDEETNTLTMVCTWIDRTQAVDPSTANPICILSGLKASPKADAAWDENECLDIVNIGEVSYKIYLRASSLYSFAQKAENQAKYGLTPFSSEIYTYNGGPEQGAWFGTTYATFEDAFTLDKSVRQGWYSFDSQLFYYVDHVALTGIQKVPSHEDASQQLFYNFGETGACQGTVTGLIERDGKLYYAMAGVQKFGWQSAMDENGDSWYYYFDPYTGAAVDGECKVEGYNYVFDNCRCVRGELVWTDDGHTKYRFAGLWQRNQWIDWEGEKYYIERQYVSIEGGFQWVRTYDGTSSACHLFDTDGRLMSEISGLYDIGADTYLVDEGIRIEEAGLVYIDGYYYYFAANAKAVKNRTYWPSKTNGLLPMGPYTFDEYGRMTNPPVTEEPEEPDVPVEPDTPVTPDTPEVVKDGIVHENGGYFYYKNGVLQYAAGLILIDGDYYYIRSNGQAAVGNYWVTTHNGLLPAGMYTFGADGKMIVAGSEPEEPGEPDTPAEVKNGVVNENGVLYYYIDGVRGYCAGLVKLSDDEGADYYIYVRSNAQLATGKYWPTNTNDLLPQGLYDFGADGRYYPPTASEPEEPGEPETPVVPEVKNGIVEENGVLYYYIDGTRAYNAGVLKLTDENGATFYIYVRSNAQLATGTYWPTNTNGLLNHQAYNWGTDGRLYL